MILAHTLPRLLFGHRITFSLPGPSAASAVEFVLFQLAAVSHAPVCQECLRNVAHEQQRVHSFLQWREPFTVPLLYRAGMNLKQTGDFFDRVRSAAPDVADARRNLSLHDASISLDHFASKAKNSPRLRQISSYSSSVTGLPINVRPGTGSSLGRESESLCNSRCFGEVANPDSKIEGPGRLVWLWKYLPDPDPKGSLFFKGAKPIIFTPFLGEL